MAVRTKTPAALSELVRNFKRGYGLEHTSGGHWLVKDPQGNYVVLNGKRVTLTGTAHGGRAMQNMQAQLKAAGVLRDSNAKTTAAKAKRGGRISDEANAKRIETLRETTRLRAINRQKVADALHERLAAIVKPVGGIEQPGMQADLAHIAAMISRRNGSSKAFTPDLLTGSVYRIARRHWIIPEYQQLWERVLDEIEAGDDVHDQFFALVRESRGLPQEVFVDVKQPASDDWPFRVELLSLEALMVDHSYQRPVPWAFVRKNSALFDESLVGTIDVAERGRGAVYAILDGQLRYEMCRLVGKTTVWASVYSGLDLQSEARFFLHKNRDKKAIHPFYTFRARIAAGDADALAIERIVKQHGYTISIVSAAGVQGRESNISAIAAIQEAYTRKRPDGSDSLTPTLRVLRKATLGMRHGQNHILIRGTAIAMQHADDVDEERMAKVLLAKEPELLLARAREAGRSTGGNAAHALSRLLIADYNRGLRSGKLGDA